MWWGLKAELAKEGPPLPTLGTEPMELEGSAEQVQEDGATVADDNMVQ